jgi:phosphoglycerate dehydrogenase-like enzyme
MIDRWNRAPMSRSKVPDHNDGGGGSPGIMTDRDIVIAHHLWPALEAVLRPLLPPGVSLVELPRDAAFEVPAGVPILLAGPMRDGLEATRPAGWPRSLEWVHTVSTGIDEYPSWLFDVPLVTCGRGANSAAIGEFVMASLLAVAKRIPEVWISSPEQWRILDLATLKGKTLGLLGHGSIARETARRALAFEMEVLAWRRSGAPSDLAGVQVTDLDTVLSRADHLVVTLPRTRETQGMIDAGFLARVKPGAHLVNVSRGGVIDQPALLNALDGGRIGFASLDVTDPEPLPAGHPLYSHPRVRVSPHISWSGGSADALFTHFVENVTRFRSGRELLDRVDTDAGY